MSTSSHFEPFATDDLGKNYVIYIASIIPSPALQKWLQSSIRVVYFYDLICNHMVLIQHFEQLDTWWKCV